MELQLLNAGLVQAEERILTVLAILGFIGVVVMAPRSLSGNNHRLGGGEVALGLIFAGTLMLVDNTGMDSYAMIFCPFEPVSPLDGDHKK